MRGIGLLAAAAMAELMRRQQSLGQPIGVGQRPPVKSQPRLPDPKRIAAEQERIAAAQRKRERKAAKRARIAARKEEKCSRD